MYLITIIPFSDERFLRECTIFICTGVVGFTGRGYRFFGVDLGGYIFLPIDEGNIDSGQHVRTAFKQIRGIEPHSGGIITETLPQWQGQHTLEMEHPYGLYTTISAHLSKPNPLKKSKSITIRFSVDIALNLLNTIIYTYIKYPSSFHPPLICLFNNLQYLRGFFFYI